jgi:hypothetical protein
MLNAYWEPLAFEVPKVHGVAEGPWRLWIDTALESPRDIADWPEAQPAAGPTYVVQPRSVVAFLSRTGGSTDTSAGSGTRENRATHPTHRPEHTGDTHARRRA